MSRSATVLAVVAMLVSGCAGLEARYHPPPLPVTDAWPIPPTVSEGVAADIGWRDFFVDPSLQQLIARALAGNRDLRVAIASVDKARATYRVQRAARLPSVDATGRLTRARDASQPLQSYYAAGVGVTGFEVDLFGRVASLSHAALQQYLAESEARRAAQLSVIAEVANAYLTLAADGERLRLARATLDSQQASFHLAEQRHALGAASGLDLSQARTTVESARADAARYAGAVAQDEDALMVLVGSTIDTGLKPTSFAPEVSGVGPLPAGLPSTVLLRRPDVLEAEHALRAANASIGAARAAFFPTISLTGSIGSSSTELSGLFKSGTASWSFVPLVTLPIFQGGANIAGLGAAHADRDIALARYEQAIQQAFREVSDGLALTATLAEQHDAQQALAAAAGEAYRLSDQRYRAGRDSYLLLLDAQRSSYAAQQALISTRLDEQTNRVTLYKALGGGWREASR